MLRLRRWLFRSPLSNKPHNPTVRRARFDLERLESREVPAAVRLGAFDANSFIANDDDSEGPVDLGFTVRFAGSDYDRLYVNNNGNVTFGSPLGAFTPTPIGTVAAPILAPFWADVDTRVGNTVTYGTGTVDGRPAFGVNWPGVGYFPGQVDKLNEFQLVIVDRSDLGVGAFSVEFNYDRIEWETGGASGGSGGLGGNSARVGYSTGPGTGYELPGSATNGAFVVGGVHELPANSMNSDVEGRYTFWFGGVPADSVGGTIWDDANRNGTRDAGEAGIAGVSVTLSESGEEDRTATTGDDGSYRFDGTSPGSYTLVATAPAGFAYTQPVDGTRTVTLTQGQPVAGADFGLGELPTVSVSRSGQASEGGATATLTFSRSGWLGGNLAVQFSVSDDSAVAGVDYLLSSGTVVGGLGTVTIPDGESSVTITLTAIDDAEIEADPETATFAVSSGSGYAVGGTAATVEIFDNDYVLPANVQIDAYGPAAEGGASGKLVVSRDGTPAGDLLVRFSISEDSAHFGSDYSLSGVYFLDGYWTATIPDGQSSVAFYLNPEDDTEAEGTETATFGILSGSGYVAVGSPGTVSILDNDSSDPVTVSVSPGSLSLDEGKDGTVTFTRSGGSAQATLDATVQLLGHPSIAAGATWDVDYTVMDSKGGAVTLAANSFTVHFGKNETSVTYTVNAVSDSNPEPDEGARFEVADGGSVYGRGATYGSDLVVRDTSPGKPIVSLSPSFAVDEGQSATFTATRTGSSSAPLVVSMVLETAPGSTRASWNADFVLTVDGVPIAVSSNRFSVTIPDGSSTATIGFAAKRDGTVEGIEAVQIRATATGSSAPYSVGSGKVVATIEDDPPVVQVVGGSDADERDSKAGSFTLTRTGGDSDRSLVAWVALSGTATKSSAASDRLKDYTVVGASYNSDVDGKHKFRVTFAAGQTTAVVQINPIDDDLLEVAETVVLELLGNGTAYELGSPSERAIQILDDETALAPLGLARNGEVRTRDGAIGIDAVDLTSSGFGVPWGQRRVWTNDPMQVKYAGNQWGGNGWVQLDLPSLLALGESVVEVQVGTDVLTFDKNSVTGAYAARFFVLDTLVHDAATKKFVLTRTDGTRVEFLDFDDSWGEQGKGQFDRQTSPGGLATLVGSRTDDGKPLSVGRSGSVAGQPLVAEAYVYEWSGNRIASVTLERYVAPTSVQVVRRVQYEYYGASEAFGNEGDLKTATVTDAGGAVIDRSYYRYYKVGEAGGYAGGLKYSFGPAAFERLLYGTGNPFGATDAQAAAYADLALTYDSSRRVARRTVAGAGPATSTSGSGQGTFTYTYVRGTAAEDFNAWKVKATVVRPDGTRETAFSNAYAETMVSALRESGGNREWVTYTKYDAAGRAVMTANPSAVTGYDAAKSDLVHYVAGNAQYLRDDGGLISFIDYAAVTNPFVGSVAGYVSGTRIANGEFAASVPQTAFTYDTRTLGSASIHPVHSSTIFRNADGSGAQTTTFAYDYYPGTLQPSIVYTTLPVVAAGQNGPGFASVSAAAFDAYGRQNWSRDAAGAISLAERDLATGAVVRLVEDVSQTAPGVPLSFLALNLAMPGGNLSTGKNRETVFEVDELGRTTRMRDANLNVTFTAYNDPAHEVRTYRGARTVEGQFAFVGPVESVRVDRGRNYVETATFVGVPETVWKDGELRPTGKGVAEGIQSLTRAYANAAGQTIHSDAYFAVDGYVQDPFGTAGVHFLRTRYEYGSFGRLAATISPGGRVDGTTYDRLGRLATTLVNGSRITSVEYDNGGVGDGNRTAVTAYPGPGQSNRVARTWYDWRNRAIAVKDGVQTTEDTATNRPLTYVVLDNLGQPVSTAVYDGDRIYGANGSTVEYAGGVPAAPAAGLLRGLSETLFDDWGRVYRSIEHRVDQATGAVASTALSLVSDVWYDLRGFVAATRTPNGLVEKTQYDGLGEATVHFASNGGGDSNWFDALDVAGDLVLTQDEFFYDSAGNPSGTISRTRFDGQALLGKLGDPSSTAEPKARVSYSRTYYDAANRPTDFANLGTDGINFGTTEPPSRSDESAQVTSLGYDAGGRMNSTTDPLDRRTESVFDLLGRAKSVTLAANTDDAWTTGYEYDAGGRLEFVTEPGNRITKYAYDGFERPNLVTERYGTDLARTFGTTYNQFGEVRAQTAPDFTVTKIDTNVLGRVTTTTSALGTTVAASAKATYDVFGRTLTVTDPRNKVTRTTYDDVLRTVTTTDPTNVAWTTAFDLAGNAVSRTDGFGKSWLTAFDVFNRVEGTIDPLGNTRRQKYLVDGDKMVSYDGKNNTTTVVLDNFDRTKQTLDQAGKGNTYTYDRANRIETVTDARETVAKYEYDDLDRVRKVTEALGLDEERITRTNYDFRGDRTEVIDGRNILAKYEYDSAGRVERVLRNANSVDFLATSYEYDAMDRATLVTYPGDRKTFLEYDEQGRLKSETTGYLTDLARTTKYEYDPAGNLTKVTDPLLHATTTLYDDAGRVVRITDALGGATRTTYDAAGRRRTVTDPVGNVTTFG